MTPGFLASGEEESDPGPGMRLDCSELFIQISFIKVSKI